MKRKVFATSLKSGSVAFLLAVILFADKVLGPSSGYIRSIFKEVISVFHDGETQWVAFLCLGIYFAAFSFFRCRVVINFCWPSNPNLWLVFVLLISAVVYTNDYSLSTEALTLLGGAVLGRGIALWAAFESQNAKCKMQNGFGILVVSLLLILLGTASVWQTDAAQIFNYRNHVRWSGPWDNPNIFGLLMGTGVALALGFVSAIWHLLSEKSGKWCLAVLCFLAAILMGRALLHSYSRGAWVGAVCGGTYLLWHLKNRTIRENDGVACGLCISQFKKCWFPLSAILASVVMLSIWHLRQTDWRPMHRAFSVANQNDFSWRNRVAAWEGDFEMMAEKPIFGFGWNKPEPLYQRYYLPFRLTDGVAIEMNDYLMLGATLGIPALFCFGMYLWLTMKGKAESGKQKAQTSESNVEIGEQKLEMAELAWLKTTCRAGALVLAVGFWFDGGLFKLPTAATFWILIELGRE